MNQKEFLGLVFTIGIVIVFIATAIIVRNYMVIANYTKAGYHQVMVPGQPGQEAVSPKLIWVKTEGCP